MKTEEQIREEAHAKLIYLIKTQSNHQFVDGYLLGYQSSQSLMESEIEKAQEDFADWIEEKEYFKNPESGIWYLWPMELGYIVAYSTKELREIYKLELIN